MRLTEQAIARWRTHLQPGDHVLDATAGNGHDTLALAEIVGQKGHVWALDRQEAALEVTQQRLALHPVAPVTLWQGDHAQLIATLPTNFLPQALALITFNLGYLPGSDHQLTTTATSTLAALGFLLPHLAQRGALSIIAYRGHPGGLAEAEAVEGWLREKEAEGWKLTVTAPPVREKLPPVWFWAERP